MAMLLSEAIVGFLLNKDANGLKQSTMKLYRQSMGRLHERFPDREVTDISREDYRAWFVELKTFIHPNRNNGSSDPISGRTRQMIYDHCSAFFRWLVEEGFLNERPDRGLKRPRAEESQVMPFTEDEVKKLLKACNAVFVRDSDIAGFYGKGRSEYTYRRMTAVRDRAILLVMLSTAVRGGELVALNRGDVTLENGEVHIAPQKTPHSRTVYLDKSSRRALWAYLHERAGQIAPTEPLFATIEGDRFGPTTLRRLFVYLGKQARVLHCHPHRMRHTAAIFLLRNGMDLARVSKYLGHSSLEVTMHYLKFVPKDIQSGHEQASPGDKWRL